MKLARAQKSLEKFSAAIDSLEKAKNLLPAPVVDLEIWRLLKLGRTLKAKQEYPQAIRELEKAKAKLQAAV